MAAGGLQNPRLLQLSLPRGHPSPVGDGFATHPHPYLTPHPGRRDRRFRVAAAVDSAVFDAAAEQVAGPAVTPAMQLSSEFCAANGLLSAALTKPRWPPRREDRMNLLGRRKDVAILGCTLFAEMPLLKENRVSLSDTPDFLGQPKARVSHEYPRQTLIKAHQALSERLTKSGLGRVGALPVDWQVEGSNGHMLCATRMGREPATSVVDGDCRVHGIRGLYVAGSSVFAAAGLANPTYTIVALSLRLADHLAKHPPE